MPTVPKILLPTVIACAAIALALSPSRSLADTLKQFVDGPFGSLAETVLVPAGTNNDAYESTARSFRVVASAMEDHAELTFTLTRDGGTFLFSFGYYPIAAVTADPRTDKLGYAIQALSAATVVFDNRSAAVGDTSSPFAVASGTELGFFLIPNNTIQEFLSDPERFYDAGDDARTPLFSVSDANPEERDQLLTFSRYGLLLAWEDLSRSATGGSDNSFTDVVIDLFGNAYFIAADGPIAHDNCAGALDVPLPEFNDKLDTRYANDRHDVWYRITPSTDGVLTIDATHSNYVPAMYIARGACDGPTFLSGGPDIAFAVTAGTSYAVQVFASDSTPAGGVLDLAFRLSPPLPPPSNDACEAATPITSVPFHDHVDTRFATLAATDPPSCIYQPRDENVWYSFTTDVGGELRIDTGGSEYRYSVINVHSGTCAEATAPVTCWSGSATHVSVGAGTHLIEIAGTSVGALNLNVDFTPLSSRLCESAIPIDALPFVDIRDADLSPVEDPGVNPCHVPDNDTSSRVTHQLWYRYVSDRDAWVYLNASGTVQVYDVAVYGGTCTALNPRGCNTNDFITPRRFNPDWSDIVFRVTAGSTYYIEIQTLQYNGLNLNENAGFVVIKLETFDRADPPANDDCHVPRQITALPYDTSLDIAGAAFAQGFGSRILGIRSPSVWFSIATATDVSLTAEAVGESFGTAIAIYDAGCDDHSSAIITSNRGGAPGTASELAFNAKQGHPYLIEVIADGSKITQRHDILRFTVRTANPPQNDACPNADIINALPFATDLDSSEATLSAPEPDASCGSGYRPGSGSVWYEFTAAEDALVAIDFAGTAYVPTVTVYTGTCNSVDEVFCDGFPLPETRFGVLKGVSYRMRIGDHGNQGRLAFSLMTVDDGPLPMPTPAQPPNDECGDPKEIPSLPFRDAVEVSLATTGPVEPFSGCTNEQGPHSVWYRWQAPGAGIVTIDTAASDYNTVISVWQGACGLLTEVDCHSDPLSGDGGAERGRLTFAATAGATYLISIAGVAPSAAGTLHLKIEGDTPATYDTCAMATDVSASPFPRTFETSVTTTAAGDPDGSCGTNAAHRYRHSTWYRFTALNDGLVAATASPGSYGQPSYGQGSASLIVQNGTCERLTEVVCATTAQFGGSRAVFRATAGRSYLILVYNDEDTVTLSLEEVPVVPPANDSCSAAAPISVPGVAFVDSAGASAADSDPVPSCAFQGRNSSTVWYRFTPDRDLTVKLITHSEFQPVVTIYTGACGMLHEVACNPQLVALKAGVPYLMQIAARGSRGGGPVEVLLARVSPPANDDCKSPTAITAFPFSEALDFGAATVGRTDPPPSCGVAGTGGPRNTVWYRVRQDSDGFLVIDTDGSTNDPTVAVYTGACGSLVEYACYRPPRDLDGPDPPTSLGVRLAANTTYLVATTGGGSDGTGKLSVSFELAEPVANDECVSATEIALRVPAEFGWYSVTGEVDAARATDAASDPPSTCGLASGGRHTTWYRVTSPADGIMSFGVNTFDTLPVISVFKGTCGALEMHACAANYRPGVSFPVKAGEIYFVEVGLRNPSSPYGSGFAYVAAFSIEPDWEAECTTSYAGTALPGSTVYNPSTRPLSDSDPEASCSGQHQVQGSVWHRFTSPIDAIVRVNSGLTDQVLAVYAGNCDSPQELACSDDGTVTFPASAGLTYLFQTLPFGDSPTRFDDSTLFSIDPAPQPTPTPTPAPPPNDSCTSPVVVEGIPFVTNLNTIDATSAASDPAPSCRSARRSSVNSVWYRVRPSGDGTLLLSTFGSSYDTMVAVYEGGCANLTELACNDNVDTNAQSRVAVSVREGVSYLVAVTAAGGTGGNLKLSMQTIAGPPNDACEAPTTIAALPYANAIDATAATTEAADPYLPVECRSKTRPQNSSSVWYRMVAPADGFLMATTAGSDYDTVVAVYKGTCGALVPMSAGCNDDLSALQKASAVTFPVTTGTAYVVEVMAWGGRAAGQLRLAVRTAAGETPIPSPSSAVTPAPTPTRSPDGRVDDTATARAAVKCARTIRRAAQGFTAKRARSLTGCVARLFKCVQTIADEAKKSVCLTKAGEHCTEHLAKLSADELKVSDRIELACDPAVLPFGDVIISNEGLGFTEVAARCRTEVRPTFDSLDDVVACIVGQHACAAEQMAEAILPRAGELLRIPRAGISADLIASFRCLNEFGGDGGGVSDPEGLGKVVVRCAAALAKAGNAIALDSLSDRGDCVGKLFDCVQKRPGDESCRQRASASCSKRLGSNLPADLGPSVARACADSVVAYDTLREQLGVNVAALVGECAELGVPALNTLNEYMQCIVRRDRCLSDDVMRFEAPRAPEILGDTFPQLPAQLGAGYCPAALPTLPQRITVSFDIGSRAVLDGVQIRVGYPKARGTFVGSADGVHCIANTSAIFQKNANPDSGSLTLVLADAEGLNLPVNVKCRFDLEAGQTLSSNDLTIDAVDVTQNGSSGQTSALSVGVNVL